MRKTFIGRAVARLGKILFSVSAHSGLELAFDRAGNLFQKGRDSIFKIAPDGTETGLATTEGSFPGMAIDAAGNVCTAEGETMRNIAKVTPHGKQSTFASGFEYGEPFELVFSDPNLELARSALRVATLAPLSLNPSAPVTRLRPLATAWKANLH
jgi:hypothetical protein